MKNSFSNYYYTSENTRIFYTTNFSRETNEVITKPIVFIYGLVCSNHQWFYQTPYFDEQGYKIITHDFRGHHASGGKDDIDSITFKNITCDLNGLLTHLNTEKNILVAHSMGVNIALEFARLFPERVEKLVLISGSVLGPKEIMFNSNVTDLAFPALKWLSQKAPRPFDFFWKYSYMNPILRKIVHEGGFNTKTVDRKFITAYLKHVSELSYQLFYKLIEEMTDHDIINYIERIEVPTLLISGDCDNLIPHKHQLILKKHLKNTELYIVRNGSHVPQADFPDLVNKRIERFITKN
ncbi:MAG: hypothetical protein A2X86_05890 [Bdellovibrionales bacterium GWA2_49_15]|nr:MAG: hypothetical protein A2X86_05890 [Bdellovibrionales bacterium GWA2_49_15]